MKVTFNGPMKAAETVVEFTGTVAELLDMAAGLKPNMDAYHAELRAIASKAGGIISAIKLHRERTGATLKDSKDYVEAVIGRRIGVSDA